MKLFKKDITVIRWIARSILIYAGVINLGGIIWFGLDLEVMVIVTGLLMALCSFIVSLFPRKYLQDHPAAQKIIIILCSVGLIAIGISTSILYLDADLVISTIIERFMFTVAFFIIIHEANSDRIRQRTSGSDETFHGLS